MTDILAGSSKSSFTPENLVAGEINTNSFATTAGLSFVRGEVVCFENNKITKLIGANKANVFGIMVHTLDTTVTKNTKVTLYIGGLFNSEALTLSGVLLADIEATLSRRGISITNFGGQK